MDAPPHSSMSAPSPSIASSEGSIYSPSETTETSITSPPPSLPLSSSSFSPRDSSSSSDTLTRHEINNHQQQKTKDLLDGHIADDGAAGFKTCTCRKPRKGSKRALMDSCNSANKGFSMRKACVRCAGGFAADCTALCCCPCAVISLLAFVVIELPSALARRMITHLKKRRLAVKDSADSGYGNRDEDHSFSAPTRLHREPCKAGEAEPATLIRFSTENLLKHFDAEHVGFGCLSQKRD